MTNKSYDNMNDMERREAIATRLGLKIISREWPCGYYPKSRTYVAALSRYDQNEICLGELDLEELDLESSLYCIPDLVYIKDNVVVPVPNWTTDITSALELNFILVQTCPQPGFNLEASAGKYRIRFYHKQNADTEEIQWNDTIAGAICRAFIGVVSEDGVLR